MRNGSCHRRFEIEAARDGRITGHALDVIEQHIATCKDCTAEARTMEDVAHALGALPVAESDAVRVRRQRQRLLAAFNDAQLVSHRRRTSRRLVAGALVAGALATLVAVAAIRAPRLAPSTVAAKAADHAGDVVVVAPDSARWSRSEEGTNTRVNLEEGELSIHVKHHGDAHGLFVTLPDGELEDIGTTFRVRVQDGRTVAINVREGAVVFRRGQAAFLLGAGESWPTGESAAAAGSASGESVAPPPHPSPPKHPSVSNVQDKGGGGAKEFRDAVDRLNAGDAAGAALALRTYLARKPAMDRSEDATYLLVLALRRSGDEASAIAVARDYLRLYPQGLRRREIASLASAATGSP